MAIGETQHMAMGETVNSREFPIDTRGRLGIGQKSPKLRLPEIEKKYSTDSDDCHHGKKRSAIASLR